MVEAVEGGGLPLGVLPGERYPSVTLRLSDGDALLLVTDGITEARRFSPEARRGREFEHGRAVSEFLSFEGLVGLAKEAVARGSVPGAARAILDGAKAFAGGRLHDDACLLLARKR